MLTPLSIPSSSRLGAIACAVALVSPWAALHAAPIVDDQYHVIWSHQSSPGTGGDVIDVTHDGGALELSVTSNTTRSAYIASATSSTIGLVDGNGLKLSIEGISFSGGLGAYNEQLIIGLTSEPTSDLYSGSMNALAIYIDASSGIRMGFKKTGVTNSWPWGSNVVIPVTQLNGVVTGLNLSLSATSYTLEVHTTNQSNPVRTFTGSLDLGSGWDELALITQYRKGSSGAGSGGVTISNLMLQPIPEPSVAMLAGAGALVGIGLFRQHARNQ